MVFARAVAVDAVAGAADEARAADLADAKARGDVGVREVAGKADEDGAAASVEVGEVFHGALSLSNRRMERMMIALTFSPAALRLASATRTSVGGRKVSGLSDSTFTAAKVIHRGNTLQQKLFAALSRRAFLSSFARLYRWKRGENFFLFSFIGHGLRPGIPSRSSPSESRKTVCRSAATRGGPAWCGSSNPIFFLSLTSHPP